MSPLLPRPMCPGFRSGGLALAQLLSGLLDASLVLGLAGFGVDPPGYPDGYGTSHQLHAHSRTQRCAEHALRTDGPKSVSPCPTTARARVGRAPPPPRSPRFGP